MCPNEKEFDGVWRRCSDKGRGNTVYLVTKTRMAAPGGLVGWGQERWWERLTAKFDILRFTTRGLARSYIPGHKDFHAPTGRHWDFCPGQAL